MWNAMKKMPREWNVLIRCVIFHLYGEDGKYGRREAAWKYDI